MVVLTCYTLDYSHSLHRELSYFKGINYDLLGVGNVELYEDNHGIRHGTTGVDLKTAVASQIAV